MRDHIILRRSGALGDVILTTPVLRRLRREFPGAIIQVQTACPEVFDTSPHLAIPLDGQSDAPVLINLDLAYEKRPHMHIVQAYMHEAFGDPGEPHELQQELAYPDRLHGWPDPRFAKFVAVHAAVAGWRNRTLPRKLWREVIDGVRSMGLYPLLLGTSRDGGDDLYAAKAYLNAPLAIQAAVIDRCVAFIGSDSALLHLAGTTDTPIVGIFTCARPETRLPWRHGQLGWKCEAVIANLSCAGCLADRDPPVTTEFCKRGDSACVTLVTAEETIKALIRVLDSKAC